MSDLTLDGVARRVYTVLTNHQSRTAIDLTRIESLRIVVCPHDYDGLVVELARNPLMQSLASRGLDNVLRIRGVQVDPDLNLDRGEVRLRTELSA